VRAGIDAEDGTRAVDDVDSPVGHDRRRVEAVAERHRPEQTERLGIDVAAGCIARVRGVELELEPVLGMGD
jgi:hypothetical protein